MNKARKLLLAAAACAAIAVPLASFAAPVVYTNKALFLAAISGAATDSFNDLTTSGLLTEPLLRTAGGYGYTAGTTSASGLYSVGPSAADRWLSSADADSALVFNAFTGGVFGVGGYFFSTDVDGDFVSANVTVTGSDGVTSTQTIMGATTTSFVGFYSSSGITSVVVAASQLGAPLGGYYATANDLVLGGRPPAPPPPGGTVPEPGSLPLIALAAAVLFATTRRARSS